MAVTSKDIGPTTRRNAPLEPGGFTGFSIGTFGLVVSAIFWIFGARWTIDGLVVMFNAILHFLSIPYQAPVPPHYLVYAILCPVPIIFSAVEWNAPFKRVDGEWYFAKPGTWFVWSIAGIFDAYTTYLGLGVDPGPDAVTFMRQLSVSGLPRALLALTLTIGPEWLGKGMMSMLRSVFARKK
jgi:hypothetical protein